MADHSGDKPIDDLHDSAEPFDPRQWAIHGLLSTYYDLEAGRTCPAVSDLWRHATEDQPLDPNEAHVQDCPRCQKQLLLIRRELEADSAATMGRSVKSMWPLLAGGLAMAACLMLLVAILPSRTSPNGSYDSQIASAFEVIDAYGESELRGGQADEAAPRAVHDEWLKGLLSDPEAVRALAGRGMYEPRLHTQYHAGHLRIENNRMVLAPGIVVPSLVLLNSLLAWRSFVASRRGLPLPAGRSA